MEGSRGIEPSAVTVGAADDDDAELLQAINLSLRQASTPAQVPIAATEIPTTAANTSPPLQVPAVATDTPSIAANANTAGLAQQDALASGSTIPDTDVGTRSTGHAQLNSMASGSAAPGTDVPSSAVTVLQAELDALASGSGAPGTDLHSAAMTVPHGADSPMLAAGLPAAVTVPQCADSLMLAAGAAASPVNQQQTERIEPSAPPMPLSTDTSTDEPAQAATYGGVPAVSEVDAAVHAQTHAQPAVPMEPVALTAQGAVGA